MAWQWVFIGWLFQEPAPQWDIKTRGSNDTKRQMFRRSSISKSDSSCYAQAPIWHVQNVYNYDAFQMHWWQPAACLFPRHVILFGWRDGGAWLATHSSSDSCTAKGLFLYESKNWRQPFGSIQILVLWMTIFTSSWILDLDNLASIVCQRLQSGPGFSHLPLFFVSWPHISRILFIDRHLRDYYFPNSSMGLITFRTARKVYMSEPLDDIPSVYALTTITPKSCRCSVQFWPSHCRMLFVTRSPTIPML